MPIQLLDHADSIRRAVAPGIALKRKSALGQFMTPAPVARFMASLFPPSTLETCALLFQDGRTVFEGRYFSARESNS